MRLYYRLRVQPHIFVALSLISKSSLPRRDCLQPLAKCKIELSAFLLGAFLSSYSQPASQPVSLAWPSTNYTQLIEASARRLAERVELNVLEIATYVFRRIFANVPPPKIPCLPAFLSFFLSLSPCSSSIFIFKKEVTEFVPIVSGRNLKISQPSLDLLYYKCSLKPSTSSNKLSVILKL